MSHTRQSPKPIDADTREITNKTGWHTIDRVIYSQQRGLTVVLIWQGKFG